MTAASTFVVHIDEDGNAEYLAFGAGDARFLVVDERAPHDRVYRITQRSPRAQLEQLIAGSPIGDRFEPRHAALAHVIRTALRGEDHLQPVND